MIAPKRHLKDLKREKPREPSRMFKYRLDRNERNQPFSGKFIKELQKKISGELFMVYPEVNPVHKKLARWLRIGEDELLLHSGSEQAIKAIFETYIRPGERVLLHFPGFAMYKVYCQMFGARIVSQIFDSRLRFNWDEYINKITRSIRMVVIENPNGFLGIACPLEKLKKAIKKAHAVGAIILVDEAYFHFHDETVQDLIHKYDNLIVCRTFSKAFGLAGLRAGYLISQADNIKYLKRVSPAYELNAMAILLISGILDHIGEFRFYINETKRNLIALRKGLSDLGISSSDSRANFVAAKLGAQRIHARLRLTLKKRNILIRRPFRERRLQEWVRISTAPAQIQNVLLKELRRILKR